MRRVEEGSRGFHPSGWLRASDLTCCLISLVGVQWSSLRINKQAPPPFRVSEAGITWHALAVARTHTPPDVSMCPSCIRYNFSDNVQSVRPVDSNFLQDPPVSRVGCTPPRQRSHRILAGGCPPPTSLCALPKLLSLSCQGLL